jgi:hypothetical protein
VAICSSICAYWPSASPVLATLLPTRECRSRRQKKNYFFFLPFFFFFAAFAFFAFFAMLPS